MADTQRVHSSSGQSSSSGSGGSGAVAGNVGEPFAGLSLDDSSLPVNFHGNLASAHDDEELTTLLQRARISKRPAVVTYGAPWCHACRQMLPTFCNLSNDYESALFIYADVDKCYETTRDVRYTPTFRFYRDGEKVDEFYGAGPQRLRDRGGSLTRKPQKWATTQFEKLLGGGSPWFNTTVAILCICTSIYLLQILISKGEDRTDLKDLSGVLNGLPLTTEPPPPFTQRFLPRSGSLFDSKFPPPSSGVFYGLKISPPPGATKPNPLQSNTVSSSLHVEAVSPLEIRKTTDITRVVFGIGAAAKSWDYRKEYIKLWWRLNKGARGFVWLDTPVDDLEVEPDFPALRISADTSSLRSESRSGVRMFRIISETLRLGLPDIDWLVLGDDDTVFFPENLVKVLSKYDHNQMFYVGSNSESNVQNLIYSYSMAFGGGGFAISYPLAKELSSMEDDCLARYPQAYGSDDRIHACMSELGVALTKEPGFHQMDIHGNPFGLLAAHPVSPLVSLHHMDAMDAIFPDNGTRQEAVAHLVEAAAVDQASLLQQSMCYCQRNKQIWSISVSWSYAVQIYKGYLAPRELEIPVRTFNSVLRKTYETEFSFNTREFPRGPCEKPTVYYMSWVRQSNEFLESEYKKKNEKWTWWRSCDKELEPINAVQKIRVTKEPVSDLWFQAPRRSCCQLTGWTSDTVNLHLGACQPGQSIATLSPGWD